MKQFLASILIVLAIDLCAQSVQFKREYDLGTTNYSTLAGDLYQMPDSGFIFTCGSGQWPDSNVVLMRTDKWGVPLWTRTYHVQSQFYYPRLIKHNINRYTIFTGTALIGIDSSGSTLWSTELSDEFSYCASTRNNGLILQGRAYDSLTEWTMSVVKLDSVGNILWSTSVDSLLNNGIQGVVSVPLSDGNEEYVLLGTCYTEYNNYSAITCISENGILQWNKLTLSYSPMDLTVTPDSSILLSGVSLYVDSVSTSSGIAVHKMRFDGALEYSKTFGPFDPSWCKIEITADTILLSGSIANPSYFGQEYFIAIDTAMNIIWQRRVSGGSNSYLDVTSSFIKTSDGGYAQLTSRQTVANGQYHLFLIKANSSGSALCNEFNLNLNVIDIPWFAINDSIVRPYNAGASPFVVTTDTIDVTNLSVCSSLNVEAQIGNDNAAFIPNPANNQLAMEFNNTFSAEKEIRIYNVQGSVVLSLATVQNQVQLDVENLPAGLYLISVNGSFLNRKLVIFHP